ncbi:MAG: hypothetical protein Q8N21_04980 [bacterium]|nr:hypothetical protein [bacterium]
MKKNPDYVEMQTQFAGVERLAQRIYKSTKGKNIGVIKREIKKIKDNLVEKEVINILQWLGVKF